MSVEQLAVVFEGYMDRHIKKIKSEHQDKGRAFQAVVPLWDRLDTSPLRGRVARQIVDLIQEAFESDRMNYQTEQVDDLLLVTSVVPKFEPAEAHQYFKPPGYLDFTVVRSGGTNALERGDCIAHWTLCIGPNSPMVHLTVLPSLHMMNIEGAMMLWATDLLTQNEWAQLKHLFQ